MAGDAFAALMGQLKERSGLSYGTLGKRLHLSASTLHRYVNGDAVPVEYAPVERFARLCRATPEELVELHRLWVRADVTRGRKGPAAGPAGDPTDSGLNDVDSADVDSADVGPTNAGPTTAEANEPGPQPPPGPQAPSRRRLRRTAVLVGTAVAATAASVALVVGLTRGDTGGDRARAGDAPGRTTATAGPGGSDDKPAAPTVATAPHTWENPCSQHYLVDRQPEQVPPPPMEQDAPAWVAALDAVPSGDQLMRLTVQGTGARTVVLEALHVRLVSKRAPLAWNDYVMGVGCGGQVSTKSFAVDLDAPRPGAAPAAGQRAFPYSVSESDPEVFFVAARARAHDVSWYLELVWSSGTRRGTVRIDDDGRPFRTSGNLTRPAYAFPLGGTEWTDFEDGGAGQFP
ncbi:helix-turn-helix transcriptional regulator [Streptomyces sp. NPDC002057]|uniref:helix-turn-helix domain-containing protein n=1 Tax=Streptomyces sp. NPDC002057 TaxID=3154664 RepID=UPI003327F14D